MPQRKVCLVGDFSVGKTSLFNRFVYNRFSESYLTTVGVLVQRKVVYLNGEDLTMILWDTEGGKDSSTINVSYISGAAGAIIVCDLTRVGTILHCQGYVESLRRINKNIHLTLAGNKHDLLEPDHKHLAVMRQIAKKEVLPMTLTSAMSGEGVDAMFDTLGAALLSTT
jgi:small GTP-binding protein